MTQRQVAKELGIDVGTIKRARADKIDPTNLEAMKRWQANRNEYTPRGSESSPTITPEGERLTIEEIEDRASRTGQTKRDVEVYKVQLEVMKAAAALRQQRNQLLSRDEVDDRDARIMHALQGMFRRMENEIPALCYGLNSLGEMKDVVKTKIRELQDTYADGQSEFWKSYPET